MPVAVARAAARAHPDWTLAVLPGIGHVPQLEAPGETAELVTGWLGQAAPAGPLTRPDAGRAAKDARTGSSLRAAIATGRGRARKAAARAHHRVYSRAAVLETSLRTSPAAFAHPLRWNLN